MVKIHFLQKVLKNWSSFSLFFPYLGGVTTNYGIFHIFSFFGPFPNVIKLKIMHITFEDLFLNMGMGIILKKLLEY